MDDVDDKNPDGNSEQGRGDVVGERAEADATEALALAPAHSKSLLRRAKACMGCKGAPEELLQKLKLARKDLKRLSRAKVDMKAMMAELTTRLKALGVDEERPGGAGMRAGFDDDDDDDDDDFGFFTREEEMELLSHGI